MLHLIYLNITHIYILYILFYTVSYGKYLTSCIMQNKKNLVFTDSERKKGYTEKRKGGKRDRLKDWGRKRENDTEIEIFFNLRKENTLTFAMTR